MKPLFTLTGAFAIILAIGLFALSQIAPELDSLPLFQASLIAAAFGLLSLLIGNEVK